MRMIIKNHSPIKILNSLVEKIGNNCYLQRTETLLITIKTSKKLDECGGIATSPDDINKDGEIELILTLNPNLHPSFIKNDFLETLLHEIGHIKDAQDNGIDHWNNDPFKGKDSWKNPAELIANKFKAKNMRRIKREFKKEIKDFFNTIKILLTK